MIDYILAAFSAGLIAFLSFFILSFITLSLMAGIAHVFKLIRQTSLAGGTPLGREQIA